MSARKRRLACDIESALDRLIRDPHTPFFPLGEDYLILSDFHMGDRSEADNFKNNEDIAFEMIDYYSRRGYIAVLNGDIEELWQFSSESVRTAYHRFFTSLRGLFRGRIIRLYGNHDAAAPYPGLYPGIILRGRHTEKPLLVTHGHLGSSESDLYSWFSRICVRLFCFIEPVLIKTGLIRAPLFKRPRFRHDFEKIHEQWAGKRGYRIICGHSHRAVFASRSFYQKLKRERKKTTSWKKMTAMTCQLIKEIVKHRDVTIDPGESGLYFNCGCGLYKKGITAIEIRGYSIRLVKWEKRGRIIYEEAALENG